MFPLGAQFPAVLCTCLKFRTIFFFRSTYYTIVFSLIYLVIVCKIAAVIVVVGFLIFLSVNKLCFFPFRCYISPVPPPKSRSSIAAGVVEEFISICISSTRLQSGNDVFLLWLYYLLSIALYHEPKRGKIS